MTSFFPWMGGKANMATRLCRLLPKHTCYVEVFAGAANLLFVKNKSKVEVINDINSELINLFRVVRHHPREFVRELSLITHSRVEFNDYKAQPGLTDIQKATRSWFVMKTAFGGKGGTTCSNFGYGATGKSRLRRTAFSAIRRCHRRLDGVYVENLDYTNCIKRYDRPFAVFYCDPPYVDTVGYKSPFGDAEHARLAEVLRGIKGKFLLSINDSPKVRRLYKGLPRKRINVKYSIAREKTSKARDRVELVIANYPLPRRW